jgi:hypothetical protein
MKVAVLFEHSGTVRDAFKSLGHDAISFDILQTETPGKHIIGDVTKIDYNYWKQFELAVCHPPCTYLSYAANRFWYEPGREEKRQEALKLFMWCLDLPIERICVENPMGLPHKYIKCSQIIHPYYFGDAEMKRTCLWLKNLPLLEYSEFQRIYNKPEPHYINKHGKRVNFVEAVKGVSRSERWKLRSKFFPGVSMAMAAQWTNVKYKQITIDDLINAAQ